MMVMVMVVMLAMMMLLINFIDLKINDLLLKEIIIYFVIFSIVISACTIGGCGDSPATQKRTLTDKPSGQPAPSGIALSSTSIRVVWDPPSDPNSPIQRYELYRKTIEEPVNPNFTAVNGYDIRYRGIQQTFDDPGLGIYSLQRYKVKQKTQM